MLPIEKYTDQIEIESSIILVVSFPFSKGKSKIIELQLLSQVSPLNLHPIVILELSSKNSTQTYSTGQ